MCFLEEVSSCRLHRQGFWKHCKKATALPASLLERWLRPLGNNGDIFKGPSVAGEKDFQNPEELCPKSAVTEH